MLGQEESRLLKEGGYGLQGLSLECRALPFLIGISWGLGRDQGFSGGNVYSEDAMGGVKRGGRITSRMTPLPKIRQV